MIFSLRIIISHLKFVIYFYNKILFLQLFFMPIIIDMQSPAIRKEIEKLSFHSTPANKHKRLDALTMVDDSELSSSLSSQSECETSQSKKARKTLIMDSQQNNQKQVQSNISKAKSSVSIHEEGEQDEEYNEETYGFNNNSIKELPDLT